MDSKETIAEETSRKSAQPEPRKLSPVQEWDYYVGKVIESSICGKKGFKRIMRGKLHVVNIEFITKAHVESVMNNAAKTLRLYRKACDKTINKTIASIEADLKKLEGEISEQEKKGKIVNFFSSKLSDLNKRQLSLLAEMRGVRMAHKQIKEVSPSIFDSEIDGKVN